MHRIVVTWAEWKYDKGWVEISYLGEKNKTKSNNMHLQNFLDNINNYKYNLNINLQEGREVSK